MPSPTKTSPSILAFARRSAALLLAGACLAGSAPAADKSWNGTAADWSLAALWTPVGMPGMADRGLIGNLAGVQNSFVTLDIDTTIAGLELTDGMGLATNGKSLVILGDALVSGRNRPPGNVVYPSQLAIERGAGVRDFDADVFTVADEAWVRLVDGGILEVDAQLFIDADSSLAGRGVINLKGTSGRAFILDGRLDPYDGMVVNQLGAGLIDLDGNTGTGTLQLNGFGDQLTINGTALSDSFNGTIAMFGEGTLNMNFSDGWTAAPGSLLNLFGPPTGETGTLHILGGHFTCQGHLNALATVDLQIGADTTFNPGALVTIGGHGEVRLNQETIVGGGSFELGTNASLNFFGDTTVRGGTFTTVSNSELDGAVSFHGPTAWDGSVTIHGAARQMGDATVVSATTISADRFNMDGAGAAAWTLNEALTINAGAIDTIIDPRRFDGTIEIGSGLLTRLTMNLTGASDWEMAGQMTLAGNVAFYLTRVAGTPMHLLGELSLTSGFAQITADVLFADGSTTTLPAGATLRMSGDTQIDAAASFVGTGTLRNATTGVMNLRSGASLDQVRMTNDGVFLVEDVPAAASVARFENTANGTWLVNICGDAPGSEHDLLLVSDGPATLAGHLDVDHYNVGQPAFRPEIGDSFTILTALGGVSGTFAENPHSYSQGMRFDWTVLYGSNDVTIQVAAISQCPAGDLDDDGDIDIEDLAILLAHFGTQTDATYPWGDLNSDGDVDIEDLATLLSNFGASCE